MNIYQPDNTSQSYTVENLTEIGDIEGIAGREIKDLCDRHKALLVFPDVLGEHHDGIESQQIFTITRPEKNKIEVKTGNLMGFIGCGDSKITIYSRFADCSNGRNDYFLHYMLQRVFSINLFDLQHNTSEDEVFDFMLYLFPHYLKQAVRQGIFRQYCTHEYNDANIRGPIDVPRHIRRNIPFNGRISYRTREHSYDNPVTQLIRHTIEYIRRQPANAAILTTDSEMCNAVAAITAATPSYVAGDCQKIIRHNSRPACHPLLTKYVPLQQLCLNILWHKNIKFRDTTNNRIYGVLFDGAWLWEEYLYKAALQERGFKHPENKRGKGGIYLFDKDTSDTNNKQCRHCRYPDYFKDGIILDAKYKHLENDRIDRDDMHQLIAYMYVEEDGIGGFIYPHKGPNNAGAKCLGVLRGHGGKVYNIGVAIPEQANDYKDFCTRINAVEEDLKNIELIKRE